MLNDIDGGAELFKYNYDNNLYIYILKIENGIY